MSAGRHARIYTRIWHDPDFLALSVGAQRLYMLALSQDSLTLCGVTTFTEKRWSRLAKSSTPASIRKDILELVKAGFVVTDDDTEEMWVRSYLKWDGVLSSPNMIIGMASAFEAVHSEVIRGLLVDWFCHEFPDGFQPYLLEHFPKGFPRGLPEGFIRVLNEALRELACARTTVPAFATTTSPEPFPPDPPSGAPITTDDDNREAGLSAPHRDEQKTLELTHRMVDACDGDNRRTVNFEAGLVVCWALQYVAPHIIDEAIGSLKTPPSLPRAIAVTICKKAADHGIRMPEYQPHVRGVA